MTQSRLSPDQQTTFARMAIILIITVVVGTVLFLVLRMAFQKERVLRSGALLPARTWSPHETHRPQLCNTTSCRESAALLKETLWGDPCADFYKYVCSGWLNQSSFTTTHDSQRALLWFRSRSMLRHMSQRVLKASMSTRLTASAKEVEFHLDLSGSITSPSSDKATMLYNACLAASVMNRADALAEFLTELGIGFFDSVKNPVSLALQLDLFYNLKTLFDLHRHATWRSPGGQPLLVMSLRTDMATWRRDRDNMRRCNAYRDFVERHVTLVLANERIANETEHKSGNVEAIVSRIMTTEVTVLSMTSTHLEEDPDRYYDIVPLFERDTSSAPQSSSPLKKIEYVAVGHPAVLSYFDFLEDRMVPEYVASYITWEVVRQLGPLADQRLSYGTSESTCFGAIYTLMPYPTVLPYMEELDFSRGWEEAELVYRDVSEDLFNFVKKRGVVLPAMNASFSLDMPTREQLDAFYSELALEDIAIDQPFLYVYIAAMSQIRSKELSSITDNEATYYPLPPARGQQVQVSRSGPANVPLTWLLPPRFGTDVPPALNYGAFGLGLVTAAARHVPLDQSWLDCLARLQPQADLTFDGSFAARMALATEVLEEFVDLHMDAALPVHLPDFRSMSQEQLFFVGACIGLCARGDARAPFQCNLAARNSPRFQRAFGCSIGSHMYTQDHCPYSRQSREI